MNPLVTYYLDGVDLREYGVYVSKSQGLLDRPAIKERTKADWPDRNGVVTNHSKKRLQERTIVLSCFIKAEGQKDLVERLIRFNRLFDTDGQRQLVVDVEHPRGPLVYMVDCEEEISVDKTWSRSTMAGTFELRLTEDEPVKRLFKFAPNEGDPCLMRIRSQEAVTVHWGDGTASHDAMAKGIAADDRYYEDNQVVLKHEYDAAYYGQSVYIVVAGNIDALTDDDTQSNADLLFSRY